MEFQIFFIVILAQMCNARTTIVKGLRTPYVHRTPPGPSLDEGPCRFYFFSDECRAWISAKKGPHLPQSSLFIQNSDKTHLKTNPPVLKSRSDTATIKDMSSMIPVLIQSFEELCLRDPASPRCPRKSKKVFGPFYVNSRKPKSNVAKHHSVSSRQPPGSKSNKQILPSSHRRNIPVNSKSRIVMAIVSRNQNLQSHTIKQNKEGVDLCSHPFHSWQCRSRSNQNLGKKVGKQLRGAIQKPPIAKNRKPAQKIIDTLPSDGKKYQKCSHSFHSWLCLLSPSKRPKSVVTTAGKTDFNNNVPTTTKPTVRSPHIFSESPRSRPTETKYDKCSHPFHSWLCRKAQTHSKPVPVVLKKPPKINVTLQPPKANPKTYMNPCTHSFHSWLCKALNFTAKKKSSSQTKSSRIPFPPTTPIPYVEETTALKIQTTTHKVAQTTVAPEVTTPRKESISFVNQIPTTTELSVDPPKTIKYDPCSHGFHSWRCKKGKQIDNKPTTSRTTYVNFVTLLPKTTTEAPQKTSSNTSTRKTKKPSWKGANPCSHAFHSWLCRPLRPKLTFKPFDGSPNLGKALTNNTPPRRSTEPSTTKHVGVVDDNVPVTTTSPPTTRYTTTSSTTSTTTTTTLPPVTPSRPIPVRKKKYKKWEDSCNHPFHSWLCRTFKRTATIVPSYEIPNIRSLPLENEFPSQSLSPLNFGKVEPQLDDTFHFKRNTQIPVEAKEHITHVEQSTSSPTTESTEPSTFKPIRYKSISFSVPTNPIFKSIPNISLLPLEISEQQVGDRTPRYAVSPSKTEGTKQEPIASGSRNQYLRTFLGPPETESPDLTQEDISEISYFLELESQRMKPRKIA